MIPVQILRLLKHSKIWGVLLGVPSCYWYVLGLNILLAGYPLTGSGQEITATLNLDRKEPKPLWFEYCRQDSGLVTISYMRKNSSRYLGLYKYNAEFKRTWVKQFLVQNGRKSIEYLFSVEDRILVIVSEEVASEKRKLLYFYDFSLSGSRDADSTLLANVTYTDEEPDFRFYYSLNKKKLLCYYKSDKEPKGAKICYFVIDENRDNALEGCFYLPYKEDQYQIKQTHITNHGNLYFLVKYFQQGKKRNFTDYTYQVLHYYSVEDSLNTIEIPWKEKIITDMICKPDRAERLYLGGFYSGQSRHQVKGTVYARLNADTLEWQHAEPYKEDLLIKYLSPRQIEKGKELGDFFLDDIFLRSDGGILILAEQYYITSANYYRSMTGVVLTRDLYHYDDVLLTSISPDGQIEWASSISKAQSAETHVELSYLCLVGSSGINVFYKTRMKGPGTNVYYNQVEYDGTVGKPQILFPQFHGNDVFYREFSEQISNNEAILSVYRTRQKTFSLIKLEF